MQMTDSSFAVAYSFEPEVAKTPVSTNPTDEPQSNACNFELPSSHFETNVSSCDSFAKNF